MSEQRAPIDATNRIQHAEPRPETKNVGSGFNNCENCGRDPMTILCEECNQFNNHLPLGTTEPAPEPENYVLKKDEGKVSWRLLPFLAIEQIVKVMLYGAKKHTPGGWAKGTYENARVDYFDAAYRHLVIEWWEKGITIDPESGLPHLAHAGCNVVFLIWYELKYKLGGIPEKVE